MIFSTFPDHAQSQIFREPSPNFPGATAAGSTAACRARRYAPAQEPHFASHGGPAESRVLHPLPTCQNEGYSRVITPPTRRYAWLTRGYQRGIWLPEMQAERRVSRVPFSAGLSNSPRSFAPLDVWTGPFRTPRPIR